MQKVIIGCGDIGRRVAKRYLGAGEEVFGTVSSEASAALSTQLAITNQILDLDAEVSQALDFMQGAGLVYTIAPQKLGQADLRSQRLLAAMVNQVITPSKVVLISTTGVYGDCDGEWVDEQTPLNPSTDRAHRRVDMERQWAAFCQQIECELVILRVPGIYAFDRLPRDRLKRGTPVVRAEECGFINRIHADDLANAIVVAMQKGENGEAYNATDGHPGKIPEYLQAACALLKLPPLPEISREQAQTQLSEGMLSYLSESRKISNQKIVRDLGLKIQYPDFKVGMRF